MCPRSPEGHRDTDRGSRVHSTASPALTLVPTTGLLWGRGRTLPASFSSPGLWPLTPVSVSAATQPVPFCRLTPPPPAITSVL